MTLRFLLIAVFAALAGPAAAAEPFGEWLVKDKTADIRLVDCAGALWGVVAWEKDPGVDAKNPDPKKRSRPTLGMPILLGMKPAKPGEWQGAIYNSDNGKTYSGGVIMNKDGGLRIYGCVLGFLCGGESWTRVTTPPTGGLVATDDAICTRAASG